MKCLTIVAALVVCSVARPADEAPLAVLPYGLPYAAINSGLVYPVAEAYVHDPTGDTSDNSSPEPEAEADAQYLTAYRAGYNSPVAYSNYGYGFRHYGYSRFGYGKREAEAEPYLTYGAYSHGYYPRTYAPYGYGYPAYTSYGYGYHG